MLKREWLEIRVMDRKQWLIEGVEEDIIEKIEKIQKSEARDDEMIKAVK